jgi:hypothetical protein
MERGACLLKRLLGFQMDAIAVRATSQSKPEKHTPLPVPPPDSHQYRHESLLLRFSFRLFFIGVQFHTQGFSFRLGKATLQPPARRQR